jgi:hypothetical protein
MSHLREFEVLSAIKHVSREFLPELRQHPSPCVWASRVAEIVWIRAESTVGVNDTQFRVAIAAHWHAPFSPLFEEERHIGVGTLVSERQPPIRMHRAGIWPGLSASYDPIDCRISGNNPNTVAFEATICVLWIALIAFQIRVHPLTQFDRPQQRLATQKQHRAEITALQQLGNLSVGAGLMTD